jgi:hypothetical protein
MHIVDRETCSRLETSNEADLKESSQEPRVTNFTPEVCLCVCACVNVHVCVCVWVIGGGGGTRVSMYVCLLCRLASQIMDLIIPYQLFHQLIEEKRKRKRKESEKHPLH